MLPRLSEILLKRTEENKLSHHLIGAHSYTDVQLHINDLPTLVTQEDAKTHSQVHNQMPLIPPIFPIPERQILECYFSRQN